MARPDLLTPRLVLRAWCDADRAPLAAINADPDVMRHFPAPLNATESDAMLARQEQRLAEDGFAFLPVALRDTGEVIGFCGLARVRFEAWFTPAVEIGWRLARAAWGRGYATEAARACLAQGFGALGLHEIVAFTVPANTRSRAVMARLGMVGAGTFDHPSLAVDSPLRRHVVTRILA